jgi:hypothetical protein
MHFAVSGYKIAIIRRVHDKPLRYSLGYGLAAQFARYGSKAQGRSSHFPVTQAVIDSRENDQATDTEEQQD